MVDTEAFEVKRRRPALPRAGARAGVAWLTVARRRGRPTCPDEGQTNDTEPYAAVKRPEVLTRRVRMDLGDVALRELSQSRRARTAWFCSAGRQSRVQGDE